MKTVIDLVKDHLQQNGYDGLALPDGECGCQLRDFQPCGEDFGQCRPAYQGVDQDGHWVMYLSMEDAEASTQNIGVP